MADITGTPNGETLIGTNEDDLITGLAGNDLLLGLGGSDVLDGGEDVDTASYSTETASVAVTLNGATDATVTVDGVDEDVVRNVENVLSGSGDDTLTGDSLANALVGAAGDDTLSGNEGDDRLLGGLGNDTLDGGADTDTADYIERSTSVVVTLNGSADVTVTVDGVAEDTIRNIESIFGGAGNDTLTGDGLDNTFRGGAGSDALDGGDGSDTADYGEKSGPVVVTLNGATDATVSVDGVAEDTIRNIENLNGGSGDDALTGDANANVLIGDSGADLLSGGDGDDTLMGGIGIDTLDGGADADTADYSDQTAPVVVVLNGPSDAIVTVGGVAEDTIRNIENVTGGAGDDALTGDAGNNVLAGEDGADLLNGGDGLDTLIGGLGIDTADYGDRTDSVQVVLNGIDLATVTIGVLAEDTVAGIENLIGGSGDDAFTGDGENNLFQGGAGGDQLSGEAGNDTLDGGAGADTMVGGFGDDTYLIDDAGDVAVESFDPVLQDGIDTVISSVSRSLDQFIENLTLTGSADINGTGNDLANSIIGTSGANILDGGSDADAMEGGAGNDTYVVDNAGDATVEAADGGTDDVQSSITFTLAAEVENLALTGSAAINGIGNELANSIIGNSANNTLDGGLAGDAMQGGLGDDTYVVDDAGDVVTENGSEGTDTVQASITYKLGASVNNLTLTGSADINGTGTGSSNTLLGNSGNNRLDGRGGADTMAGGAGDDTYVVDDAGDLVTENGGEGTDTVEASITYKLGSSINHLTLIGAANINATGTGSNNTLIGNSGNNALDGGGGADAMAGGAGNDTYVVDNAGDVVTENGSEGTDTVQASITYKLGASVNNLTLTGTADINGTGSGSDNSLKGNTGANTLSGGDGEDVLKGGDGDDTLTGGGDADIFVFGDNDGDDIVTDFENGSDKIDLTVVDDVDRFRDLDVTDTGDGVLIDYGNGTIHLEDVARVSSITASDFIFA